MVKNIIRSPIHLSLLALAVLTLSSCGNGGGGGISTQEEGSVTATLSWDAPTTNTDGTELTDLTGYKVYYGTSSGVYDNVIDVADVTTYTLTDIAPATYYFAVTAYDELGNESDYSNEVSKTIP